MPYVPSEKTPNPKGIVKNGKAQDRVLINADVIKLSEKIADNIEENIDILDVYLTSFVLIGGLLLNQLLVTCKNKTLLSLTIEQLARTIYKVGEAYNYQGAFLGELNYAITRLIQEVPKRLVEQGKQESELRYFIYAYTVEALIRTSYYFNRLPEMVGISGVFEDIKDEYKRRVNTSYEAHQIVKSGDCYNTLYYTKLIEVVDVNGKHMGYQEVMVKGGEYTSDVIGKIITVGDKIR